MKWMWPSPGWFASGCLPASEIGIDEGTIVRSDTWKSTVKVVPAIVCPWLGLDTVIAGLASLAITPTVAVRPSARASAKIQRAISSLPCVPAFDSTLPQTPGGGAISTGAPHSE